MKTARSRIFSKPACSLTRCHWLLVTMALLASFGNAAIHVVVAAPTPASEVTANCLDSLVPFGVARRVAIGMTRDEVVVSMLGRPDDKLGNDLWIYWNCRASGLPAGENYTALIVFFAADRVKLIRLTDAPATKRLLLQFRGNLDQGRIVPPGNRPEGDAARLTANTKPR